MNDPAAPKVLFERVTKCFGEHVVLDALDLAVAPGEKLAIIGRSGSGKSTLLRILMTLTEPTSGRVLIEGRPIWRTRADGSILPTSERELRVARARVGFVFQQFNLFAHMTALRNVALAPMRVLGKSQDEAEALALELLARVGLKDKAQHYPAQLSGGQQQRVAIARALAPNPEIMMFDEVTSALDPELVDEVLAIIRELAAEQSMTMLIVTHEMAFARRVARRVAFFDAGKICEIGPPEQLFDQPQQQATATFLRSVRSN
jgi:polar amino acid transport system ATP-binding protein